MGNNIGLSATLNKMMDDEKALGDLMMRQGRLRSAGSVRDMPSNPTLDIGVPVGKGYMSAVVDPKYKQFLTAKVSMPIGNRTRLSGHYSPHGSFDGGGIFGVNIERKF